MGIYGNMLLAFPEQMTTIEVYSMTPKQNAGWIVNNDKRQVRGLYQHTSGRQIKENNGNLATGSGLEFWTEEGNLAGLFSNIDGAVFRLTGENNWSREGGFYRYSLQKVIGNDGTESDDAPWNTGAGSFG